MFNCLCLPMTCVCLISFVYIHVLMGTDLLSTNLFMSRNLIVDCVDEFDLLLVGQGFVQTDLLYHFESGHRKEMDRSLADLGGGVRDARPPLGVQILSISSSFRENLACSRPPWRVHTPPSGKSWIRHCRLLIFSDSSYS